MKTKNTRKGFTTVELVIVIAVIAILATVLIPTFSNMINQANLSVDTQNVRNMNVVLATYITEGDPSFFGEMKQRLEDGGYGKDENFIPKTKGYKYLWYSVDNVILLVNKEGKVEYPKDYVGLETRPYDVNKTPNNPDDDIAYNVIEDVRLSFDLSMPAMKVDKEYSPQDPVYPEEMLGQPINLAVKYVFDSKNEPSINYSDWKATFYASCDLPEGYENVRVDIPLAGYYESYGSWKLCFLPDFSEGETEDLLRLVGVGANGMTYAEVQERIVTFECGVVDVSEFSDEQLDEAFGGYDPVPAGTVLTVELRLTNDETGEIVVAGIFHYTFQ